MCQFLHNIMHHLAYHSFEFESHKFFFSTKGHSRFQSGLTSSTNSRTRHSGKYKEEDGFSWIRESDTQRRDGNHAGEDRRNGSHADSGGWIVWIGKNAESCPESTTTTSSSCQDSGRRKGHCYPWLDDLFWVSNILCTCTICALVHAPHSWWNSPPCCLWSSDAYFSTYNSCSTACCNAPSSYYDLFSTCDSHRPTKWRTHLPLRQYRGL